MEYRIKRKEWDPDEFAQMLSVIQNAANVNIVVQWENTPKEETQSLEKQVGELLNRLGISPHLLGYGYLKSGIVRCFRDPREMESVTKLLYPSIAKDYDTTAGRVEHGIRHAIGKAWEEKRCEAWDYIFGNGQGNVNRRPTNAQFIAAVADYMAINN